jgi:hypothetical protein
MSLATAPPGRHRASARPRNLRRFEQIERNLAALGKDGAAIEKHCTATEDELQAAIHLHLEEGHNVLFAAWVSELALKQRTAKVRRLFR